GEGGPAKTVGDEGPRVVIIDIELKQPGGRAGHLDVPVVRRHRELPAVLRVVIAVRTKRVLLDERSSVDRTAARSELGDLRMGRARERQRLAQTDERAA